MADSKAPAKPASDTPAAFNWTQCWDFLRGQKEWREAALRDCIDSGIRFDPYKREIAMLHKTMKLIEVIQLLGPQFDALIQKNRAMLLGNAIGKPIPPDPKKETTDDATASDPAAGDDEAA